MESENGDSSTTSKKQSATSSANGNDRINQLKEAREERENQKKLNEINDKLSVLYDKMEGGDLESRENIDLLINDDIREA